MTPIEARRRIEQSQRVIGYRRWNSLTVEQRRELVQAIQPGMSDKQMFTEYQRIRREQEAICEQTLSVS